jgi:hypothetical protein
MLIGKGPNERRAGIRIIVARTTTNQHTRIHRQNILTITSIGIDTVLLLFFAGRITPNAVRRNLLKMICFVFVGRVDSCDSGDIQNVLNAASSCGDGPWNASVNTENVLINDGSKRHAIKDLIGRLPHAISQIVSEARATLTQKGSFSVVF